MKIEDYKNERGEWVQAIVVAGKQHFTFGGSYWHSMAYRCKEGGRVQRRQPTYVGCSYTWASCHEFVEWARQQIGYGTGQLDKDILLKGNKVYCQELCVFVPQAVNLLLVKKAASRGAWPIGVSWDKKARKFGACLGVNGKKKHIGYFLTPEEAFAAYKAAKEAEIHRVAALYRSVMDPRVYDALLSYSVEITD